MDYKFSEIFSWTSGKPIIPTGGNIPVYGSNGIIGYTDIAKYCNRIVLGRVGAYCGSVEYCPTEFNATDNTLITTCDTTRILYGYAFYLLRQYRLNDYAGGSAQPLITQSILKHLKCTLPKIDYQKMVVQVLNIYDNLIEINNKRIKTLEQMAENLYKEWFVRFRFPGHETAEFENGIPKGWQREKISVYYNTTSGGTPSREYLEFYQDGNIPWVKTGEIKDSIIIDTEEYITEKAVIKSSAKRLPKHCVVMAMYGVNIGLLSYLSKEMTCNQACCVFLEKREFSSKHYLFQYLKSVREYLLLISFGAAQQNLSQDLIKRTRIIMPKDELVKLFEEIVEPLYRQIINLLKQTQNLIKQRDLLLPRLMSGKLEVK